MPETHDEKRITLRLGARDVANIKTIQDHTALRSESEAVRMALNSLAMLIRDEARDDLAPCSSK